MVPHSLSAVGSIGSVVVDSTLVSIVTTVDNDQ